MPYACCVLRGFWFKTDFRSRKGVYPPSSSLDCVGPFESRWLKRPCKLLIQLSTLYSYTKNCCFRCQRRWGCFIHQALQKANLQTTSEKVVKLLMMQACRLLIMKIGKCVNSNRLNWFWCKWSFIKATTLEQVKQSEVVRAQLNSMLY